MKLNRTVLRSRVARRIFSLFILCALIPIGALTALTIIHVSAYVNEQSSIRMKDAARAAGLIVSERLKDLEDDLFMAVEVVRSDIRHPRRAGPSLESSLGEHFDALELVTKDDSETLFGKSPPVPQLTLSEFQHLAKGNPLLMNVADAVSGQRALMVMALDRANPSQAILVGAIRGDFVWGRTKDTLLPEGAALCVLDHLSSMVSCKHSVPAALGEQLTSPKAVEHAGEIEWKDADNEYVGGYWKLYLKSRFYIPYLTFVVSQPKETILAPVAGFTKSFVLVALVAILSVSLLSITLIRRNMIPLERLRAATARIARREFDVPVEINSGDEFEELADSFNSMITRLRRQFGVLNTIGEIDRTILSTLDKDKIIATLLMRFQDILPSDTLAFALMEEEKKGGVKTYVRGHGLEIGESVTTRALYEAEIERLRDVTDCLLITRNDEVPHYLRPLADLGTSNFVVFPLFVHNRLSAMIGFGFFDTPIVSHDELNAVRRVADQVAIALSNAQLLRELDELHWGTLTALARAIDAKSPWTAGHSERVTELAVKIGTVLNVSDEEMESLKRGGLLHDIGKIGVPAGILDKADKLTAEERAVMEEHVKLGSRILEPISAYTDVLPIVRQHHEWWDGSGYPEGLRGETIDLRARIFAVADCFDSLSSDRPYRKSLGREGATAVIWQQSGRQFDPRVVDAFLLVISEEEKAANRRAAEDDDEALEPERIEPEILQD